MDLELTDKVAIVTGGSMGIGKAVAKELAMEGVDVAICARRMEPLEEAAAELVEATGRRILPVQADTTSAKSVENLVGSTVDALGKVDILVNNAAVVGGMVQGPLDEASEEDLLEDLNTKVMGYFRCSKAVAPHMQRQHWGRIINIGGLSGRFSGVISGMRNASVSHLTKTLSDQLGPHGITVNTVHPGVTRTERSAPDYQEAATQQGISVDEVEKQIAQEIAIRRIVDASEIGYVTAFLASPKAESITGEIIAASGGSGSAIFQ